MADQTTTAIARMAHEVAHGALPEDVLHTASVRVLDTLGCALGAYDCPPAAAARRLAEQDAVAGGRLATVIGWNARAELELAGFINAAMARYLDFNDTYTGHSPGHPSDMIPGLLALAEVGHSGGDEFLRAVVTAYEGFGVIAKQLSVRERGWDQGLLCSVGAACGASALLGSSPEVTAEAVSLAVTAGVPTRASRAGGLSMWKGCATASSVRTGIFSARLAAAGMTGPDRAIEGKHGLWEQATGPFEVAPFGPPDPWIITSTSVKLIPAEFNSHVAVELMLALREEVTLQEIESIDVALYWNAYDEIGAEPEKWNPTTRETADHSLPYLLSAAFLDGRITPQSFDAEHLADSRLRDLMHRIAVSHDERLTAAWPANVPARLEAELSDGRTWSRSADHPRGHPQRPATDDEVQQKFLGLTAGVLGEDRALAVAEQILAVRALSDVAALPPALAVPAPVA
jgi:2-methylcitrate dehydratase